MTTKKHAALDCTGKRIKRGDIVRIIGVPELDLSPEALRESEPVFRYLVGKYKRIRDFDELGHAEIWFRIPSEGRGTTHIVWIEPHLLRLRRHRQVQR